MGAAFRTRNAYYLRISATNVIPLYLYLDERHIDWMSDGVLQHVLADLRPLIVPKLKAEADAYLGQGGPATVKRGTVDVHRGGTYQFAFFFRKTEPHSVLIKTRTFVAAPPSPPKPAAPKPTTPAKRKGRQGRSARDNGRKKRKTKGKGKARADEDSDEEPQLSTGEDSDGDFEIRDIASAPRRSRRARKVVAGGYQEQDEDADAPDVPMEDPPEPQPIDAATQERQAQLDENGLFVAGHTPALQNVSPAVKDEDTEMTLDDQPTANPTNPAPLEPPPIELEVEEEEPKPKPLLQLKYQGFTIFGQCLCVVVEPWPPIRNASRAPSVFPSRAPSEFPLRAPSEFTPAMRERTPLFLPDFDRVKSETPAPFQLNEPERVRPPVPLFNDPRFADNDDVDDYGDTGLMAFSQSVNTGDRGGGADDDDEIDGQVFFGDADEVREL